ncbi:uncharacterized protein Dvar_69160 [Desulfosarcina variabilis str. Montpellier]|uniref:hypothetical protein n=1 Tax=Desulfosarcina variabilis TaxID=2300 RepID=UPI003AFA0F26
MKCRLSRLKENIGWGFVFFMIITMLTACGPSSHAIRPDKITPDAVNIPQGHHGRVVFKVDGGWEEAILGLQAMPNSAVMEALSKAVKESKLFDEITSADNADYCLQAFIYDVDQPLMGATANVAVEMVWWLTDIKTKAVIWQESIETTNTVGRGVAMGLRTKCNWAAEAATKENIKIALEKIAALQLM